MAISVELGEVLEHFVDELLRSGRYSSRSEVVREGVRLIWDREAKLAALDAAVDRGLAYVDVGQTTPMDEVFDRLEAKHKPAP